MTSKHPNLKTSDTPCCVDWMITTDTSSCEHKKRHSTLYKGWFMVTYANNQLNQWLTLSQDPTTSLKSERCKETNVVPLEMWIYTRIESISLSLTTTTNEDTLKHLKPEGA